ncbi:MAG: helicase associated domain-containing protein [Candidatus Cloacimonetes bacterium]|nr:helicase associated domain-containing protein [Candidatus Cloacimonadota bacterium]
MTKIVKNKHRKKDSQSQKRSNRIWKKHFNGLCRWLKKYDRYPTLKENSRLYLWIGMQRNLKKNSKMNKYREDKLNSVNFIWSLLNYNWNRNFAQLSEFVKEKGYWPKQRNKTEPEHRLAVWMLDMRIKNKINKLSEHQIELLNSIGFPFKRLLTRKWEAFYEDLVNWLHKYNEFPNCFDKREGEIRLYTQCLRKYDNYVNNELDDYQQKQLDLLNFVKFQEFNEQKKKEEMREKKARSWESNYKKLYRFVEENNRFPKQKYEQERKLSYWLGKQRSDYRKNGLNQFQITKLNELDIHFGTNSFSMYINNTYIKLKQFREKYPNRWPSTSRCNERDERLLAKRLRYYRQRYNAGKLSDKEIELFESLNFPLNQSNLNLPKKSFEERITEVQEMRAKYGKIQTTGSFDIKSLYNWIIIQRKKYRNGKLTNKQVAVLKKNKLLNPTRINSR